MSSRILSLDRFAAPFSTLRVSPSALQGRPGGLWQIPLTPTPQPVVGGIECASVETVLRTLAAVRNPTSPKKNDPSPAVPSPEGGPDPFLFAVADGGLFSPEALWYRTGTALERLLLCRVPSADECWRVALEATESGLFRCGLVLPSQGASPQLVRRLQLAAERTGTALWLVTDERIPHWALRRGKGIGHAPQETPNSASAPRATGKR